MNAITKLLFVVVLSFVASACGGRIASESQLEDSTIVAKPAPSVPITPPKVEPPKSDTVTITCAAPEKDTILPEMKGAVILTDTKNAVVRTMTISAGRSVVLRSLKIQLGKITGYIRGHVRGESGTEYFSNLRFRDASSGAVIAGPISLHPSDDREDGDAEFRDEFVVSSDRTMRIEVILDTAATEERYNDFIGLFSFRINGSEPGAVKIVYVDTKKAVPASNLHVDDACFDAASAPIRILPRFPDLIADIDKELVVSSKVTVPVIDHPSLGIDLLNDGSEDGNLDGMTVEGLARVNGTDKIPLQEIVKECSVISSSSGVELGRAIPTGDKMVFRSLAGRVPSFTDFVPGRPREKFKLVCTYLRHGTISAGVETEVRLGIPYDSLTVMSVGPHARIMGTLNLAYNRFAATTEVIVVWVKNS